MKISENLQKIKKIGFKLSFFARAMGISPQLLVFHSKTDFKKTDFKKTAEQKLYFVTCEIISQLEQIKNDLKAQNENEN